MPKYTTSFKPAWLENDLYKSWLQQTSATKAYCRLCAKSIDVCNMGEAAIKSHMKSSKHVQLDNKSSGCMTVASLFKKAVVPTVTPSPSAAAASQLEVTAVAEKSSLPCPGPSTSKLPQAQTTMKTHVTSEQTLSAEILWALKAVCSHYSFNSCADISSHFYRMFPDSEIAKKLSCGPDKMAYMVSFGLGPYFHELLKAKLKSLDDGFILLFDEALNRELSKKQMDIHVRHWDDDKVNNYF
jgi:hypothetical protein